MQPLRNLEKNLVYSGSKQNVKMTMVGGNVLYQDCLLYTSEPGDKLLTVNGQEIEDIFDYRYYIEEEELLLLIEKADGEQWELEIGKEEYEDLGICLLYTSEKDQSCDRPRISGGL